MERVKRGVYAICGLGSWVEEGDLLVASKNWQCGLTNPRSRDVSMVEVSGHEVESDWIERARIDDAIDCGILGKRRQNMNVSVVFGPKENGPVAVMDKNLGQADLSSTLLKEPDHLEKNNWNNLEPMQRHRDKRGDAELPTSSGKRDETQRVLQAETDMPASDELSLESIVQF